MSSITCSTRARIPVCRAPADVEHEVTVDLRAELGVDDLGMKLQPEQPPLGVLHRGDLAVVRFPHDREAGRGIADRIAVAHPDCEVTIRKSSKEWAGLMMELGMAVLFRDPTGHPPVEILGHELMAVADAQHGDAQGIDAGVDGGRGGLGDAGRAARDDDAARGGQLAGRPVDVGHDRVHAQLANTPGDQMAILPARVEDDDLVQGDAPSTAGAPASAPAGRPCPRS